MVEFGVFCSFLLEVKSVLFLPDIETETVHL